MKKEWIKISKYCYEPQDSKRKIKEKVLIVKIIRKIME
jgi:hypothetical protein